MSKSKIIGDPSTLKGSLLNWHHDLHIVTGGMTASFGRDGIKRGDAAEWVVILRRVSDEIQTKVIDHEERRQTGDVSEEAKKPPKGKQPGVLLASPKTPPLRPKKSK